MLNKMKWHLKELDTVQLEFRHRGAPGDIKTVRALEILEIGSWYFQMKDADQDGKPVYIPYHRVMRIYRGDRLIWERGKPVQN